jgi:hypothetical protein
MEKAIPENSTASKSTDSDTSSDLVDAINLQSISHVQAKVVLTGLSKKQLGKPAPHTQTNHIN